MYPGSSKRHQCECMLNKRKSFLIHSRNRDYLGQLWLLYLEGEMVNKILLSLHFFQPHSGIIFATAVTACMLVPVSYFTKYFNKPQNNCSSSFFFFFSKELQRSNWCVSSLATSAMPCLGAQVFKDTTCNACVDEVAQTWNHNYILFLLKLVIEKQVI